MLICAHVEQPRLVRKIILTLFLSYISLKIALNCSQHTLTTSISPWTLVLANPSPPTLYKRGGDPMLYVDEALTVTLNPVSIG